YATSPAAPRSVSRSCTWRSIARAPRISASPRLPLARPFAAATPATSARDICLDRPVADSYAGNVATRYRQDNGQELDVRVILAEGSRVRPESLVDLPVPSTNGGTVRL